MILSCFFIIIFSFNIFCYLYFFHLWIKIVFQKDKEALSFCEGDNCIYSGKDLILKLRYNSTNYKVLRYLFDNIGREITEKELEDKLLYRNVYMNKLVSNLNLPSELRDKTIHVKGGKLIFDPAGIKKPIKNN